VLSLAYFLDMSSSGTDGKFMRLPIPSSFTDDAGLRPEEKRSRHFQLPHPPILAERPSHLEGVAESPHARAVVDVGTI